MSTRPWVLTIGLQHVRAEFNGVFPKRAKGADGSVGDQAHMNEGHSGHDPEDTGHAEYNDHDSLNEVRAIDITTAINDASGNKVTMEIVIQYIIARARAGVYMPFRYIIFNRRIWRKSNGWKTEVYTGTADPHTGHAHFSGDYGTQASTQKADSWTGLLGLASLTKPKEGAKFLVDAADKTYLDGKFAALTKMTDFATGGGAGSPVGGGVWGAGFPVSEPGVASATNQRVQAWVVVQGIVLDQKQILANQAALDEKLDKVLAALAVPNK